MLNKKTLSQRLRAVRIERGIMAKDLAAKLHITKASMSQFETGVAAPSLSTIIAIADCLDVSIDYLVGRTDNPKVNP